MAFVREREAAFLRVIAPELQLDCLRRVVADWHLREVKLPAWRSGQVGFRERHLVDSLNR